MPIQGGTADVKSSTKINDILPVYRESYSHELKAVGKIKALSYVREDYLKGSVVEGEVSAGDIPKKATLPALSYQ